MIVEMAPVVGLDTLTPGDTFELNLGGLAVFVVLGGPDKPTASGEVAVVRLSDGACYLLNAGSSVTKRAYKAVVA